MLLESFFRKSEKNVYINLFILPCNFISFDINHSRSKYIERKRMDKGKTNYLFQSNNTTTIWILNE